MRGHIPTAELTDGREKEFVPKHPKTVACFLTHSPHFDSEFAVGEHS